MTAPLVRIGDVVRRVESVDPRARPDQTFFYIDISSVDNQSKRIAAARSVTGRDAPSRARQQIRTHDVLIATTRPYLNAVAMVPPEFDGEVCSTGFAVLRAKESLDPRYLFLFVQSQAFVRPLSALVQGALYPAVSDGDVLSQRLPLPGRMEQERIVAELTEQLGAVDRARRESQTRATDVRSLRAGVTRAAFSPSPADRWPLIPLATLLTLRNDIVHPRDEPTGEYIFVGLEHVASDTGSRTGGLQIRLQDLTGRKARFRPGDIVYGYLRPYLNKVWLADIDGFCSVDQYVFVVDESRADPKYVAGFMRSPAYLASAPIGTTPGYLPRIRTNEVLAVQIPFPPLVDQQRIVEALEAQLATIDTMEGAIDVELEAADALQNALLRRAFDDSIA